MRVCFVCLLSIVASGCYLSHEPGGASVSDAGRDSAMRDSGRADGDGEVPPPVITALGFDREIDPVFLAVDETDLFWVNRDRAVMAAPKEGGAVRELLAPLSVGWSLEIFLDGELVYLYAADTIHRIPKAGGAPTEITTGFGDSLGTLAFDERYIYFAEAGCEILGRVDRDSLAVDALPTRGVFGGGATSLAVEGRVVYCSNGESIHRHDWEGDGVPEVFIAAQDNLGTLRIDPERLVWLDNDPIPGRSRNVSMYEHSTGLVTDLVVDTGISAWLDYDPERRELFWVDGHRTTRPDGAVNRFRIDTREHDVIARDRAAQGGIAHDDAFSYWTELGAIVRLPR